MRRRALGAALVAVLLAALALRLYRLDAQNFWGDEAASYNFAKQDLALLFQELATLEPHPPLYYGLLHLLLGVASKNEYLLRLPSVFFGVALVPLLYATGRRLGGEPLALLAALLAALNPFQLWYSQEARHYQMVTTLGVAATYLLLRFLRRPSFGACLAYGAATLLGMYTHYYALFLPFAHAAYLAARGGLYARAARSAPAGSPPRPPPTTSLGAPGEPVPWRPWLLIQAAAALLYVPWVAMASRIFFVYRKERPGELDLPALTGSFWLRQGTGWSLDPSIAVPATLLLSLLFLAGCHELWRRRALSLPLALLLVPTALPLVASLVRPMYQERYLFITSPAYLLILAASLLVAPRQWTFMAGAAGIVLGTFSLSLFHLYHNARFIKGEYAPLTRMVEAGAASDDAVALNGISQWYLWDYYRQNDLPVYFLPPDVPLEPEVIQDQLREIEGRHGGLWLVMAGTFEYDPEGYVFRWLNTHYYRAACQWAVSGLGCYYRLRPAERGETSTADVAFGEVLRLLAHRADRRSMAADDTLALDLELEALQPSQDHKLFVHLVDAEGRLWGQNDAAPLNGARRTSELRPGERFVERRGLRPDPGTPPGTYTILAGVYPEAGGPRLLLRPPSPASPDTLALGKVEIGAASRSPLQQPPPGFRAVDASWPDGVRLLAARYPATVGAGASAALRVLWRAPGPLPGPRQVRLALVDTEGKRIEISGAQPVSAYSSSRWGSGELVAGDYAVTIPPRLASGSYELALELTDGAGQAVPATTRPLPLLGPVRVEGRERRFTRPFILHPANHELGGLARLVGYDFDDQSSATVVTLTLFWQALRDGEQELKVFTHLVDEAGRVVAQHDSPPAEGRAPTHTWASGEFVTDRHPIVLPPDLPSGTYTLKIGLYSPTSGQRLQTLGARDAVDLVQVQW